MPKGEINYKFRKSGYILLYGGFRRIYQGGGELRNPGPLPPLQNHVFVYGPNCSLRVASLLLVHVMRAQVILLYYDNDDSLMNVLTESPSIDMILVLNSLLL